VVNNAALHNLEDNELKLKSGILKLLIAICVLVAIFLCWKIVDHNNEKSNREIISRLVAFQPNELINSGESGGSDYNNAEELIDSFQDLYSPIFTHPDTLFSSDLNFSNMHGFSKISIRLLENGRNTIGVVSVYRRLPSGKDKYINSYSSDKLTIWIKKYMSSNLKEKS
jgi:hypothetical protein